MRIEINLMPAKERLRIRNHWPVTCVRCGFQLVCHCGPYHLDEVMNEAEQVAG